MDLLIVFIFLKIIKSSVESYLAYINRSYYKDPKLISQAKEELAIGDEDFAKTLDYTEDKFSFSMLESWSGLVVTIGFILLGGLGYVESKSEYISGLFSLGSSAVIVEGLVFFGLLAIFGSLFSLPFEMYSIFRIEERHGFNKQTLKVFFLDKIKGIVVSIILMLPLFYLLISVINEVNNWWFWAWLLVTVFSLVVSWLYPTLIAPLFNKFKSLEEGELKDKVFELSKKVNFKTSGLYTMNASIRSTHGNAYFTGVFGKKRIVLFDTLVDKLKVNEIVAVLAHELGHFKLKHVRWGLLRSIFINLGVFYLMFSVSKISDLYSAFYLSGYKPYSMLLVFSMWFGIFSFLLTPINSWISRKNEFAADSFAKDAMSGGDELSSALVKLQKANHGMPLSHPMYSRFYYSHPPILERIKALKDPS